MWIERKIFLFSVHNYLIFFLKSNFSFLIGKLKTFLPRYNTHLITNTQLIM